VPALRGQVGNAHPAVLDNLHTIETHLMARRGGRDEEAGVETLGQSQRGDPVRDRQQRSCGQAPMASAAQRCEGGTSLTARQRVDFPLPRSDQVGMRCRIYRLVARVESE
jgi:hypothetical protein